MYDTLWNSVKRGGNSRKNTMFTGTIVQSITEEIFASFPSKAKWKVAALQNAIVKNSFFETVCWKPMSDMHNKSLSPDEVG